MIPPRLYDARDVILRDDFYFLYVNDTSANLAFYQIGSRLIAPPPSYLNLRAGLYFLTISFSFSA